MRGAYRVTAGDGGQPLHMDAEQVGEGGGLGFTQLGELRGHVRDGAVMLAQLRTGTNVLC